MAGERQPTYEQQENSIIQIINRNQVFIDGRYLESAQKVRIAACPPRRIERTDLEGDFSGYGTIIPPVGSWKGFRGFDALSKDGIHWRRVSPGNQSESDDILGACFDEGTCLFVSRAGDQTAVRIAKCCQVACLPFRPPLVLHNPNKLEIDGMLCLERRCSVLRLEEAVRWRGNPSGCDSS